MTREDFYTNNELEYFSEAETYCDHSAMIEHGVYNEHFNEFLEDNATTIWHETCQEIRDANDGDDTDETHRSSHFWFNALSQYDSWVEDQL